MTEQRKPFSIETYSPEKRYETRDGRPARVSGVGNPTKYPVVALVGKDVFTYTLNGAYLVSNGTSTEEPEDLFESASQPSPQPSPQPDDWAAKAQADRDAVERKRRRDLFAAAALTGLLANPEYGGDPNDYAEGASAHADAMLAALDGESK